MRKNLKMEIEDMLSLGIIRESSSPFAFSIVIVKKDGLDRICVDYRKLKNLTVADPEPLKTAVGEKQVLLQNRSQKRILANPSRRRGHRKDCICNT